MSTEQTRAEIIARSDYYETKIKPLVSLGNRAADEKRRNDLRFKRSLEAHHKNRQPLAKVDTNWPPSLEDFDAMGGV